MWGENRYRGDAVEAELRKMSPEGRIASALDTFPLHTITPTVSGKNMDLLHHLLEMRNQRGGGMVHGVFVDTLLYAQYSPQTLTYIRQVAEQGVQEGYVLHTYTPLLTLEELSSLYPGWDVPGSANLEYAKYILKQEPLDRAFGELGTRLWMSGARGRDKAEILRVRDDGIRVLYPLADVGEDETQQYRARHKLEANKDYLDVLRVLGQGECGIHLF